VTLPRNGVARQSAISTSHLFTVLGPVLGLVAFTAVAALAGVLAGWHQDEMLVIAAGAGTATLLVALLLVYYQIHERRLARRVLQRVEARVSGIVDSAMDAIIIADDEQRIVLFNSAAEKVFRWPRAAVLGQPLDMLIPERLRTAHRAHIDRFGQTGVTSRGMDDTTVLVGLRANGEEFPIDASISQLSEGGRKLFTVILRDVTERVRVQEALRQSREDVRELSMAAHSIREQEKSRIARELHDELAQALTALKMDVSWLVDQVPSGDKEIADRLTRMQALLDSTVAATRRISADLRPLMLDDLGLVPGVEWLVQNFTQRTGIPCELAIGASDLELQDPHATAVFRILQESLTNVARHAEASLVEVVIERSDACVTLSVRDNGRGFVAGSPRKPNSYGLLGVRERAHLLGGEARIDSTPGQGTTVEVRIPIGQQGRQS
jgi:PAS domain S-box-containing protein